MTKANSTFYIDEEPLLVSAQDAANLCGVSTRTWRRWVAMGFAPKPMRIGRSTRWAMKGLQAWVQHEFQRLNASVGCAKKG